MKTIKLLLAVVLLPLSVLSLGKRHDDVLEVQLVGTNPSLDQTHSESPVPIDCFLDSDMSMLIFVSDSLSTTAQVEFENLSTGFTYYEQIVVSSTESITPIPSVGDYSIRICLTDGMEYYGEFSF